MPLASEIPTSPVASWRKKVSDYYTWCKITSLCLNMIYMIHTFEYIYDAAAQQYLSESYDVPVQFGFKILIGCLMMFCLIADLIVLTTSRLSVADWYWRPGVFFFALTGGNEIVKLMDFTINSDTLYDACQQRLLGSHGGSSLLVLVSEICTMENHVNHIIAMGAFVRNTVLCGAYAAASYFYVIKLVQLLRRRINLSEETAMENMTNSYRYPITQ